MQEDGDDTRDVDEEDPHIAWEDSQLRVINPSRYIQRNYMWRLEQILREYEDSDNLIEIELARNQSNEDLQLIFRMIMNALPTEATQTAF